MPTSSPTEARRRPSGAQHHYFCAYASLRWLARAHTCPGSAITLRRRRRHHRERGVAGLVREDRGTTSSGRFTPGRVVDSLPRRARSADEFLSSRSALRSSLSLASRVASEEVPRAARFALSRDRARKIWPFTRVPGVHLALEDFPAMRKPSRSVARASPGRRRACGGAGSDLLGDHGAHGFRSGLGAAARGEHGRERGECEGVLHRGFLLGVAGTLPAVMPDHRARRAASMSRS